MTFVLQVFDSKAAGGIETTVQHYAAMFREVGVTSACLYRGPAVDQLRANGVEVIDAPDHLFSPLAGVLPALSARRRVRAFAGADPDVVIVHSDRALPGVKRLFPRAVTVAPCHSWKAKRKRAADLVVTLNADQHDGIAEQLAGSRARPVLMGNPYVPAERPAETRRSGPPRVVFCARFTAIKDPLTLLRAASLIRTRPAPEFVFIGSGPLETELRQAAEAAGPDVRVSFPGWLTDPWPEIGPDDVLVLPSHWEGLPYLLQEALDRQVMVVAADNAGNRRALHDGDAGLLFPVGDAEALAARIDRALADPERLRAMAAAGRERMIELYGARGFWSEMARALDFAPERPKHVRLARPFARPDRRRELPQPGSAPVRDHPVSAHLAD